MSRVCSRCKLVLTLLYCQIKEALLLRLVGPQEGVSLQCPLVWNIIQLRLATLLVPETRSNVVLHWDVTFSIGIVVVWVTNVQGWTGNFPLASCSCPHCGTRSRCNLVYRLSYLANTTSVTVGWWSAVETARVRPRCLCSLLLRSLYASLQVDWHLLHVVLNDLGASGFRILCARLKHLIYLQIEGRQAGCSVIHRTASIGAHSSHLKVGSL